MNSKRKKERESKTTIQSSADSKLTEINKRCSLLRLLFKYSFKYEGTLEIFREVSSIFSVKQKDLKKNYCSTINRHAICLFSNSFGTNIFKKFKMAVYNNFRMYKFSMVQVKSKRNKF